jgi:hypothetical protein
VLWQTTQGGVQRDRRTLSPADRDSLDRSTVLVFRAVSLHPHVAADVERPPNFLMVHPQEAGKSKRNGTVKVEPRFSSGRTRLLPGASRPAHIILAFHYCER